MSTESSSLEEKELHMRLFMQSTNDCIWNWNMLTNEVERSIGFKRAFAYDPDDIEPGIEWWIERLHPDDKERVLESFGEACSSGKNVTEYEYRFKRKDGNYSIIFDKVCIIRNDDGDVIRSLGAMTDITEKVMAQAEKIKLVSQIKFSEKLASIGKLTAGVGHEINNPLTIAMGNLNLLTKLLESHDSLENQDKYLERISISLERIRSIVQSLRAYATESRGDFETFDFHSEIEKTMDLVRPIYEHEGIKFSLDLDSNVANINGMRGSVQQILINLISNARDAIANPESGVIKIVTEVEQDWGRIKVSDNGKGIPDELREKVFDPFFSTKEIGKGMGMGLGIVANLIQEMKGKFSLDSELEVGTTFTIEFPISNEKLSAQTQAKAKAKKRDLSGKVLVVDDEDGIRELLATTLVELGFQVVEASHGLDGLEKLKREDFDFVLTDLKMPKMSGMEFIEKGKQLVDSDVLFIVVTAGLTTDIKAEKETILNGLSDGFISKPFSPIDVENEFRRLIK